LERIDLVAGGATRTMTVHSGLHSLAKHAPSLVFIHDAARPGLSQPILDSVFDALSHADGAAPGMPVADALKRVDNEGRIVEDQSRAGLAAIQTPQAFRYDAIRSAYGALLPDAQHDDDIAVARAAGLHCVIAPGDTALRKITYPEDFAVLESLLSAQQSVCVGTGFDAHRFGEGDFVTLCGVRAPHDRGLLGHSDADAGWHALCDAIFGAMGAGDIGDHFPPSDPQWRGAASEIFLRYAGDLVRARGGEIINVDVTLICEAPRIAPHRDAMRRRTADVLGLSLERVSVKATTTEKMGFMGRQEGLAAQAAVSIRRPL
jgi:2-C-methyl-D-erythritol 4-phosphate cytidylyltransferase/2-C-methyl-D-erythritol 2,4-cyclodiphosphate synthase